MIAYLEVRAKLAKVTLLETDVMTADESIVEVEAFASAGSSFGCKQLHAAGASERAVAFDEQMSQGDRTAVMAKAEQTANGWAAYDTPSHDADWVDRAGAKWGS
ncbi:UNVERIFIED_CONTAM: hypothetical protein K2H54_066045 [Gekko kuhli]